MDTIRKKTSKEQTNVLIGMINFLYLLDIITEDERSDFVERIKSQSIKSK